MRNVIKNLMRWANILKQGDDSKSYPIQQLGYSGKVADAIIVLPYGIHANIPADNIVLMMSLQGHEENRAAIPITGEGRPTLQAGEVAVFNKVSGATIILKQDGSVAITAPAGVSIDGDLTVSGITALGATVTSNGVDIGSTHTHSGVTTGPSNTGPPV